MEGVEVECHTKECHWNRMKERTNNYGYCTYRGGLPNWRTRIGHGGKCLEYYEDPKKDMYSSIYEKIEYDEDE